jgi:hypothetical protein
MEAFQRVLDVGEKPAESTTSIKQIPFLCMTSNLAEFIAPGFMFNSINLSAR